MISMADNLNAKKRYVFVTTQRPDLRYGCYFDKIFIIKNDSLYIMLLMYELLSG